jgi:hypothetical protein
MFGLPGELVVAIPDKASFYSLYADGIFARKTYLKESGVSLFAFRPGSAVFLFYTYPTHRAASLVRHVPGSAALPGLSKKVRVLFTVHASKVDKLKRAVGFLNKNLGGACRFDDGFYLRLYFVLQRRGKLNYASLRGLAETDSLIERSTYADSL